MGAVLVSVSLVTVRTLGAGGVVAATVSGQLVVSAILDRSASSASTGSASRRRGCSASRCCWRARRSSPRASQAACHSVAGERRRPRAAAALPRAAGRRGAAGAGWPRARCPASRRSPATSIGAACGCRAGRAWSSSPSAPTAWAAACGSTDPRDAAAAAERCRRLLDLDADPGVVAEHLGADPLLGPLVRAAPGLRVPGAVDGAELAVRAVLGQQISLAAARTAAGRLVAEHGEALRPPARRR